MSRLTSILYYSRLIFHFDFGALEDRYHTIFSKQNLITDDSCQLYLSRRHQPSLITNIFRLRRIKRRNDSQVDS